MLRDVRGLVSILVPMIVVIMVGCTAGVSVNTDYDKTYDFSKLKTFKVQLGPTQSGTIAGTSPLVVQRVAKAVETELKSKGYKVADGDPDFVAVAHGGSEEKVDVEGWGYGGWWGAGGVDTYNYTEGALVIDIVDTTAQKAIWRGTGEDIIGDNAPTEVEVDQAVAKVLAGFPPGAAAPAK